MLGVRPITSAFCLSVHAVYACAHSGACCTAGWPIAIEPELAFSLGRRGLLSAPVVALERDRARTAIRTLDRAADGACVFYEAERGRLCAVHRRAGAGLLPAACRNFPRVTLKDPRGTFITLSHFCPTAARLLLHAGDLAVVDAPPGLSLNGAVEGLDATAVMPPLLRAGMLMDLEGYSAWEREGLGVLSDRRLSARAALSVIAAATADAVTWQPGRDSLSSRMALAFERARHAQGRDAVPVPMLEHAAKAFLAAHLFASWAAYDSQGLAAVVRSLRSALTLLGASFTDEPSFIAAVRAADFRLRHTENHART